MWSDATLDELVDALLRLYPLKDERRTGWELRGIRGPERVAGHSWGVALLARCLAPVADRADDGPGLDRQRLLELAIVHDVGEAIVGDVATRVDSARQSMSDGEKRVAEREAARSLLAPFEPALFERWEEYERRSSREAAFVKDMDLLDMCLQALYYERRERYDPGPNDAFDRFEALDEFFATARPRVSTPLGRALYERIHARYREERCDG